MKFIIVELDTGDQEFFTRLADAFRYAKEQERTRRHSVEYVGEFHEASERVYTGQNLRWLLRSLDNTTQWIISSA